MKRVLVFSFAFVLINVSFANRSMYTDELIVQIPATSDKNIGQIRQSLVSVSGVTYIGFCETENCFFLQIDRKMLENNSQIEAAIKSLDLEFHFKTGTTIDKAIANCDHYRGITLPDPFITPKN